jgi:hypothetical protein
MDGRERVAQIVRDMREELLLEAVHLAQPLGHPIEGPAELADLVAPGDGERPGPGSGRERGAGRGQPSERSRHPVGEERAGRPGQGQAGQQRGGHRAPGPGFERAGAGLPGGHDRLGGGGDLGERGLGALRGLARGAFRDAQRRCGPPERGELPLLADVTAVRLERGPGARVGRLLLRALQIAAELLEVAGRPGGAGAPDRGIVLILEHEGPGLEAHQAVTACAARPAGAAPAPRAWRSPGSR